MAQNISRVITFYSYKGGVGRSMALANIGIQLAKWNYKVLLIDWDLEAPGLENYFKSFIDLTEIKTKPGLVDLLKLKIDTSIQRIEEIPWKEYVTLIEVNNVSNLHLITAGKRDENYVENVREFDYINFYKKFDGGEYLEHLREFWLDNYDFILIDSRTGLTDSSGICSIHMPDILILLFTPNEQSFYGTKDVSKKAIEGQKEIIYDRFQLRTLPIPCRIENAETILLEEWMNKISNESEEMFQWLPKTDVNEYIISPAQIINQLKVPYKTIYSFGENLAIDDAKANDPSELAYIYQTISALIANDLQDAHLLIDSRDSLIKKVKGEYITDTTELLQQVRAEKKYKEEIETILRTKIDQEKQLEATYRNRKAKGITYSILGGISLAVTILLFIFFLKPTTESSGIIKKPEDSLSQSMATAFVKQYNDYSSDKYDVPYNINLLKQYYLLKKTYQDSLQTIRGQIETTIAYRFHDLVDSFYIALRKNPDSVQRYLADTINWSAKYYNKQSLQNWFNRLSSYKFVNTFIDSTFNLTSDSLGLKATYVETGNVLLDNYVREYKSFKSIDTLKFNYTFKINSFRYKIIDSVPLRTTIEIFVCNTKNTGIYRSVNKMVSALKADTRFNVITRNNFVSSTDPNSPYYITSNQIRYNGSDELRLAKDIQGIIKKTEVPVELVPARNPSPNYLSVFICDEAIEMKK